MRTLMKRLLPMMLGMALLLTAAGCQNSNAASGSSAQPDDKAIEPESTTRIVSTVMGDIEVPLKPQRVIVNWYVGDVFALDLNVAGYYGWEHETMPFYEKLASTTKIETWDQEDILKLDPDLIITYKMDDYDAFHKIAPVLVIPEGDLNSLERVAFIGEATDRTAEAKAVVEKFETKLAAAQKALHGEQFAGKTFSINEDWGSGSYGVYYETGSRGGTLVYNYLGLQKPAKLEELVARTGEGRGGLSYEVAAEYFGDYVLWFRQDNGAEETPTEYERSPIWKSIPAVQAGNVVTIPGKLSGLFYYSDVLSLTGQLDYIVDALNTLKK
ncbi:iron complex transport system substrate-binding protein [Desulfitobacterium sp. LBE]|uniref:ABC transporter substrate-binding protein n=1 Tax=Desulfitobacterium sp. LBE TaxID=884086 RepID=UPI00119973B4|nr:ABC transporter substrate-binding protein [Desulfitobacterium sp. LBE]TWH57128.1 iron complex transport system substrate-binding protein [Desulfitobacterium sp. LBE]